MRCVVEERRRHGDNLADMRAKRGAKLHDVDAGRHVLACLIDDYVEAALQSNSGAMQKGTESLKAEGGSDAPGQAAARCAAGQC